MRKLAEFERDIIRGRTQAGLKSACSRGKIGGRSHILTQKDIELLWHLHAGPKMSVTDTCRTLKISKTTLYRYLDKKKH